MRATLAASAAVLLVVATPAFAHRVDEYLQATTIAVEKGRVQAQIRLTPGIVVFPAVRAIIDADRDGRISLPEQRAYARRVLGDLALEVDGERLPLRLVSSTFASMEEMRDGRGVIQIDFEAVVPRGGTDRRLAFENHHLSRIAVYLVNGLVSRDPAIRMKGQSRNYEQSSYRLEYAQAGVAAGRPALAWWPSALGWVGALAMVLVVLASIASAIRRRSVVANEAPSAPREA